MTRQTDMRFVKKKKKQYGKDKTLILKPGYKKISLMAFRGAFLTAGPEDVMVKEK